MAAMIELEVPTSVCVSFLGKISIISGGDTADIFSKTFPEDFFFFS